MTVTIASANLRFTLDEGDFDAGLRKVLRERPHILALQESAAKDREPLIQQVARELGYQWAKPHGGEPVLWRSSRYAFRACRPITLARPEFVGHLPGRKSRLPASIATELTLDDLVTGEVVVVLVFHMTAEIQDMKNGGGYKTDPAHLIRVLRHRREKRRLGKRARMHKRHGRTTYPLGDGNYEGMTLGGFTSCWDHRAGGTLGPRAVDIIFADTRGLKLWTLETPSDHDALVVTYQ